MKRRLCFKPGVVTFDALHLFRDPAQGIERASIAITNRRRGPGFGGVRQSVWGSDTEMVEDNLLLACGMEYKALFHQLPYGGGKVCMQLTPGCDSAAAYRTLALQLLALRGDLLTTEDLGTTPDAMAVMHAVAPDMILGRPVHAGGSGDPSPYTAIGVVESLAMISQHVGCRGLADLCIFVKGLGHVGAAVAQRVLAAGAQLIVCDVRAECVAPFRDRPRVTIVSPDAQGVTADVFVPCAHGGDVGADFSHRVRAICGAANNQLTTDDVADQLHARGILYVPDWVVNGGGLISVAAEHLGQSRSWATCRAQHIGHEVHILLEEAARRSLSPLQVAYEVCERNRQVQTVPLATKTFLDDELVPCE